MWATHDLEHKTTVKQSIPILEMSRKENPTFEQHTTVGGTTSLISSQWFSDDGYVGYGSICINSVITWYE